MAGNMGDNNFNFLMQLVIETNDAIQRFNTEWERVQHTIGEDIETKVKIKVDEGGLQRGTEAMKRFGGTIVDAVEKGESAFAGLQGEIEKAAEALNSKMPGAAQRMMAAMAKGGDEVQKVLVEIQAEIAKTNNVGERLGGMFKDGKQTSRVGKLLAELREENELIKQQGELLRRMPKDDPNRAAVLEANSFAKQNQKDIFGKLVNAAGGDSGKVRELLKLMRGEVGGMKEVTAAANSLVKAAEALSEAKDKPIAPKGGKIEMPNSSGPHIKDVRIGIDIPDFLSQIRTALLSEKFRIGIEGADLAKLMAGVGAAHPPAGEVGVIDSPNFSETVDSITAGTKNGRVSKLREAQRSARLARAGVLGTDPIAYLSEHLPEAVPLVHAMQAGLNDRGSLADAHVARQQFDEMMAQRIYQESELRERSKMVGIDGAVRSRYGSPLRAIEGRDVLRDDTTRRREAERKAREEQINEQIIAEMTTGAGYATDFSTFGKRDLFSESERAFSRYMDAVRKVESAMMQLGHERTEEEKEIGQARVTAAQHALEIAQREFSLRALNGKGDVTLDGQSVGKAAAYSAIGGTFRDRFGKHYESMLANDSQLKFSTYLGNMFGGDIATQRSFLLANGGDKESLRANHKVSEGIDEQLGPLKDLYKLHQEIEFEIHQEVEAIKLQTQVVMELQAAEIDFQREKAMAIAHTRAIEMDEARDRKRLLEEVRAYEMEDARTRQRGLMEVRALEMDEAREREMALLHIRAIEEDDYRARKRHLMELEAYEEDARRSQQAKSPTAPTGGYMSTVRNAFAMFGGLALGYQMAYGIRNQMREVMEFQQQIADIQAVLGSKNGFDANEIGNGISGAAIKYGVSLTEAAKAAKTLAQTGLEARDVVKELDYTLAASKGMGMSIEQVQELQVAVRAVTQDSDRFNQSISYTQAVLDKVSAVESRYAVGSTDLAEAIKTLTPLIDNFTTGMSGLNDSFDYTIALTTIMVDKLRITGSQAANVLKMMFSRITRPETMTKLQKDFGVKLGNAETGDYLPINDLMVELGQKYASLSGTQQKKFAVELSGGRNVHAITALLEDYTKIQQIANQSADGFGDAQERAGIATKTLKTEVDRLRASFTAFTKNTLEKSYISDFMQSAVGGLAGIMGGENGQGGGFGTLMSLVLGGGAAFSGGKYLFGKLGMAKKALLGGAEAAADVGLLTKAAGSLATIFTPGGVLLGGLALGAAAIGYLSHETQRAREEAEKYKIKLPDITHDSRFRESPQYINFEAAAEKAGLGGAASASVTVTNVVAGMKDMTDALATFGAKSDVEWAKFARDNPEKLKAFERDFVKTFIERLPDASRSMFDGMKTDGEKIAGVMDLIGGAAWSAAFLMNSAIKQLNETTQRMVDETVNGIKRIDQAQKERGVLDKIAGNVFLGDQVAPYGKDGYTFGNAKARQEIKGRFGRATKDLSLVNFLMADPTIAKEFDGLLNDDYLNTLKKGGTVAQSQTFGTLLQLLMQRINDNPELQKHGQLAMYRATGAEDLIGQMFSPVFLANAGMSQQEVERVMIGKGASQLAGSTVTKFSSDVQSKNPMAATLEQLKSAMQALINGKPETLPGKETGKGPSYALAKFSEALINTTKTIYDQVQRLNFDEMFSKSMKLGFDKPGAMLGLSRSLMEAGQQFKSDRDFDIVKKLDEIKEITGRDIITKEPGDQRDKPSVIRTKEAQQQIDDIKDELKNFMSRQVTSILGKSPEASKLMAEFMDGLNKVTAPNANELKNLDDFLSKYGERVGHIARQKQDDEARYLQTLELEKLTMERNGQLLEASVPVNATLLQRLQVRAQAAQEAYMAERSILDARIAQGKEDALQLTRERDKLTATYEINRAYDARMESAKAQEALDAQSMQNLQGMISGFRKLVTDGSIWESILAPKGIANGDKWKSQMEAIRKTIFDTINPIFKTIGDQLMDNLFKRIVQGLMDSTIFKGIGSMPEMMLQQNRMGAAIMQSGIIQGATVAAGILATAVATGAAQGVGGGAASLAGAIVPTQPMIYGAEVMNGVQVMRREGTAIPAITGVDAGTLAQVAKNTAGTKQQIDASAMMIQMKEQQRRAMYGAAGMMVGSLGGNILGKGGQYSQMGSTIGSGAGMMLGNFLLPGVGGFIGGALGGALGGFLGGKKDNHDNENTSPVIKALDAIERAQKETITTIQAQTDALLKPESRLMNLPADFVFNGYKPAFGAGGGGGGVSGQANVVVNINGGTAPPDVKQVVQDAVEEAMGNVLSNQRRNQSWNN